MFAPDTILAEDSHHDQRKLDTYVVLHGAANIVVVMSVETVGAETVEVQEE